MSDVKKYRIIVLLNALEGRDDDLNDWFTNKHVHDALKISGFVNGQRFKLAKEQREGANTPWNYLAIYELETGNIQFVLDELARRRGTPPMVTTYSIAPGAVMGVFEPITDLMFPAQGQ